MENKKILYMSISIILVIAIILGVIYYLKNSKTNEVNLQKQEIQTDLAVENLYNKNFGSYTILDGWIENKEHSTRNKFFYVKKGQEQYETPNNISVNVGTNKYAENEHEKFKTAILNQLSMQIGNSQDITINATGSNTENGYILYTFSVHEPEVETIQYYIVGDYKYVLVHETIFDNDGKNETDNAAKEIINSFKWKE